jgi:hypothetical protein
LICSGPLSFAYFPLPVYAFGTQAHKTCLKAVGFNEATPRKDWIIFEASVMLANETPQPMAALVRMWKACKNSRFLSCEPLLE